MNRTTQKKNSPEEIKTITLTIDGRQVEVPEETTVLKAARKAGVFIPTLCNDDYLEPYGGCRLCIVQIEGMRGMPTACTTTACDGMIVHTATPEVKNTRRMVIELLISDHPSQCLTCSSNQECELQNMARYLGVTEERLKKMDRTQVVDDSNPFFRFDSSCCVLCGRCFRACQEIRGRGVIDVVSRGYKSRVGTFADKGLAAVDCASCGECVEHCPVNALSPKNEFLPPTSKTETICVYCGCGCGLVLGANDGKVVRITPSRTNPVAKGNLCVKGRFLYDFIDHPDRLKTPLIKENGRFRQTGWDEALDLVARKFGELKKKYGSDALAGLSSAKCTNEENFVFQKFVRAVFGTNNVDHCARLCHSSTVAGLARAFGSGAMTNSIDELLDSDCILITGSNTSEAHPIIALRIKDAVTKNGAKLIVCDPRKIDLTRIANLHLGQKPGTDVALFNGMMNVIIEEGLLDENFIRKRTEDFDSIREIISRYTPRLASDITGISAEDIRQAALIYGKAQRASIIYAMGITQHITGTDNVLTLANLAMLTGNVGRPSTGVNPLRGQNNVQGACDLGALPNVFPGYQKVDNQEARKKFEDKWKVSLSGTLGLTVVEIMHAAEKEKIRGLYIMGENPMMSDPNINRVKKALEKTDFLVVQDIFLTETAQLADVVLPGISFAEKDGSYTNTERRIQRVRKAVPPPGEAKEDWQIICQLARRLGYEMDYQNAGEIMDEISQLTPIYGGISFLRLEGDGLQWPCPDVTHPGTPYLHKDRFTSGKGKFHPVEFKEPAELPDSNYPYLLTTGRYLFHFHTGTLTGKSPGAAEMCPPARIEISPEDAKLSNISANEMVEVFSRRGKVKAKVQITDRSPKGCVFMAFHFPEAAANLLTNDALDPIAKIPEFKVCAVQIEKIK